MAGKSLWGWIIAACVLLVVSAGSAWAEQITVYEGEYVTYPLDYQISRLAIGDANIADYKAEMRPGEPVTTDILINGRRAGSTNLLIFDEQGVMREELQIIVLMNLDLIKEQLEAVLVNVEGLRLRVVGGKLLIEGDVTTPRDMELIAKLVGDTEQVINMAKVSQGSLQIVARTIEERIGDRSVQAQAMGQHITLNGVVFNEDVAKRYEQLARMYYPLITNLLEVREYPFKPGLEPTIHITAHLMEVSESTMKGWGMSWLPLGQGSLTAEKDIGPSGSSSGALTATISNLLPKLSVARETGGARVLETASMSVRSGDPVSFHSGGEMGIPTAQGTGAVTLTFKKYGVMVDVLPVAMGNDISLQMDVEVTTPITSAPGATGVNFLSSKISTVQWSQSGDSIVIGGLISQRDSKVFDKLPDDAAGALIQIYNSEDFRKQRSQFVMFVTPTVVAGGAKEANRDIMNVVQDRFQAYEPNKR